LQAIGALLLSKEKNLTSYDGPLFLKSNQSIINDGNFPARKVELRASLGILIKPIAEFVWCFQMLLDYPAFLFVT